jgi:hypothetical protein
MSDDKKMSSEDLRLIKANQKQWARQVNDGLDRIREHRRIYGELAMHTLSNWLDDLVENRVKRDPARQKLIFAELKCKLDERWTDAMEQRVMPIRERIVEKLAPFELVSSPIQLEVVKGIKKSLADELQRWIDLRIQIHGMLNELDHKASRS